MARDILISAGEASGDRYAAMLVDELRRQWPDTRFFGCAGPRMRRAGVEAVIEAESLAVVGLVEVLAHLPRIWREYRKLLSALEQRRPELAILTDSPDFHLRLARRLKKQGVPVVYLVAPQVWAWRKGRIRGMRQTISRLLCIFPFEEAFFRENGLAACYIGHPLAGVNCAHDPRHRDLAQGRAARACLCPNRHHRSPRMESEMRRAREYLGGGAWYVSARCCEFLR